MNNDKCRCPICIRNEQFRYFRSHLPESEQAKFDRWFDLIFNDLWATSTELDLYKSRPLGDYAKHPSWIRWFWRSGLTTGETYTAVRPIVGDIIVFIDGRKWQVRQVILRSTPTGFMDEGEAFGTLEFVPYFEPELSRQNQGWNFLRQLQRCFGAIFQNKKIPGGGGHG